MPTTRIPYGVLDGRYVNSAGDTMLGSLTLSGQPTLELHAATKKYVDDAVGVGGHSHTLSAGATDVTATATELNLLDLAGLSVGQMLRATGDSEAFWGSIQTGDLPTGIDATKIANGSVSDTEYQYLSGVSSSIQTQLNGKAAESVVLKKDGSVSLTANWDIGIGSKILAGELAARDANGLKLYDNAGNGIFIKDGGNVGIGTTNPGQKLEINGVVQISNGNEIILTRGSGTNRDLYFKSSSIWDNIAALTIYPSSGTNVKAGIDVSPRGTGFSSINKAEIAIYNTDFVANSSNFEVLRIRTMGNDYRIFSENTGGGTSLRPIRISASGWSSDQFILATSGNVGIGTTDPIAKCHIGASTGLRLSSPIDDSFPAITAATRNTGGEIRAVYQQGADTGTLILSAGGETSLSYKMSLVLKGYGAIDTSQARFMAGNTTLMTIHRDGKVGIGTTTPASSLEVNGKITQTQNINDRCLKLARFSSGVPNAYVEVGNTSNESGLIFLTYPGGVERGSLRLTADSYLGIYIMNPQRRLDIYDTNNPQLRLTHTEGSKYTDIRSDSNGYLLIDPTGARLTLDAIIDFIASMGNSSKNPTTDAPADWIEIKIGGTTYYIPAYTA